MGDELRDRLARTIEAQVRETCAAWDAWDEETRRMGGPLADLLIDNLDIALADVGLRQTLTPPAAAVNDEDEFDVMKTLSVSLAELLTGVVERLRAVEPEMVEQFEFGGEPEDLFAILDRFVPAPGSPPGMTATRLNELAEKLRAVEMGGRGYQEREEVRYQLREWAGVLAAHEETPTP